MASKKLPYIDYAFFAECVRNLDQPASSEEYDLQRVVYVLEYVGEPYLFPSWTDSRAHERQEYNERLIKAIERIDWSQYKDNFVHLPSKMYGYLNECMVRNDPFADRLRETRFAKLAALSYALVIDVHPDRRKNLRPRIEAWSGQSIPEDAPTMLGALFEAWSRQDAATLLGNYGSMLKVLDPMSSRSALLLSNLLMQMEGGAPQTEAIEFDFDSSH